jgi:hypothetical protein
VFFVSAADYSDEDRVQHRNECGRDREQQEYVQRPNMVYLLLRLNFFSSQNYQKLQTDDQPHHFVHFQVQID